MRLVRETPVLPKHPTSVPLPFIHCLMEAGAWGLEQLAGCWLAAELYRKLVGRKQFWYVNVGERCVFGPWRGVGLKTPVSRIMCDFHVCVKLDLKGSIWHGKLVTAFRQLGQGWARQERP